MRIRNRHRALRIGAGAVIAAAVVGTGVAAYADKASTPDDYRTATVSYANVEQTLGLSGTITPSGRSDLSFTTTGTVAKVSVTVGDEVTRGQVLARLDTTSLQAAVTRARAQLASAKAQLAKDEDVETSTVSTALSPSATSSTTAGSSASGSTASAGSSKSGSASGATSAGSGSSSSAGGSSTDVLQQALAQLANEQSDVEAAQTAVDTAIKDASADLDAETTLCKASGDVSTESSSAAASGSSSAAPDSSSQAPADTPTTGPGSDACTHAVTLVQDAQASVAEKEKTLSDALAALGDTLTAASKVAHDATASSGLGSGATTAADAGSGTSTTKAPTKAAATPTTAAVDPASSSGASTASTRSSATAVTAATLAKDQASIDSARSDLVSAAQALSGAVITAPSSGTVAEVSITRGGSATAGSEAIIVVAPGTTAIELSASSTQVGELKVGQKTEVSPAGSTKTYTGSVTRIGHVPSTDTSGSSTYPVTVTLDQQDLDLLTGAPASVDVVLGTATHVLTVPTSAITDGSVEVYDDGAVSRVRVTPGLVGHARTVVTTGLQAGQEVVLADASLALPTTSATTNTRGGGSFGGGSFGGGAPGGVPGGIG